eukprot:119509-Prymnesium_polylepis.1
MALSTSSQESTRPRRLRKPLEEGVWLADGVPQLLRAVDQLERRLHVRPGQWVGQQRREHWLQRHDQQLDRGRPSPVRKPCQECVWIS